MPNDPRLSQGQGRPGFNWNNDSQLSSFIFQLSTVKAVASPLSMPFIGVDSSALGIIF